VLFEPSKSFFSGVFAAKDRKRAHRKRLESSFFVIFVIFRGQFVFGCGLPRQGQVNSGFFEAS
jgi:hypothetical protein